MPGDALFRLDGKIAAIVGAGSGIGAAVARGCAAHGARVACLDAKREAAEAVAQSIAAAGYASEAHELDIREGAAVARVFADLVRAYGGLDIVICTPGINVRKALL